MLCQEPDLLSLRLTGLDRLAEFLWRAQGLRFVEQHHPMSHSTTAR